MNPKFKNEAYGTERAGKENQFTSGVFIPRIGEKAVPFMIEGLWCNSSATIHLTVRAQGSLLLTG